MKISNIIQLLAITRGASLTSEGAHAYSLDFCELMFQGVFRYENSGKI